MTRGKADAKLVTLLPQRCAGRCCCTPLLLMPLSSVSGIVRPRGRANGESCAGATAGFCIRRSEAVRGGVEKTLNWSEPLPGLLLERL